MATRYDAHLQLIDPSVQASYGGNFSFGPSGLIFIRGPQKLANRWLKLFMTAKGSDPLFPDEGTQFAFLIGGNVLNLGDLQAQVQTYVDDANDQVRAIDQESSWLSPDERLRDGQLFDFSRPSVDQMSITVHLTTVSGDVVPVLIPYSTK